MGNPLRSRSTCLTTSGHLSLSCTRYTGRWGTGLARCCQEGQVNFTWEKVPHLDEEQPERQP